MKNISQEDMTALADLLDMSTAQRDDQNDSDFWVSNQMDAFASMKKKMQEKHQVFKEWDERRGERVVGGSDEFKASLFKSEVPLGYLR